MLAIRKKSITFDFPITSIRAIGNKLGSVVVNGVENSHSHSVEVCTLYSMTCYDAEGSTGQSSNNIFIDIIPEDHSGL